MKFKSFQEYLDTNKKLVEKPKVKKVADYEGTPAQKPGKEDKHKDAGGKGPVGEPQPYMNGASAKDRNSDDPKGLGHAGDKKMVYEPDVDAALKDVKTWPKVSVADWVNNNKNLSLAEFTKKIKSENGTSIKIHETSKALVEECKSNIKNITAFVREVKRNNLLEAFLWEMLKNEESFNVLGKLITQNEFYANKLDLVISEMVAAPIGLDGDDTGEEMDSDNLRKSMDSEGDMENSEDMDSEDEMEDSEDMDSEDDMEDSEDDMEDSEDDMEDSEDMDSEDMDSEDMDSEDMDSEDMDSEDMDSEDMDSEDMGSEDMGSEDMGSEDDMRSVYLRHMKNRSMNSDSPMP